MKAPERIYVEVCEDGIFAFPKPPFEESVEYVRTDLVKQPVEGLEEEIKRWIHAQRNNGRKLFGWIDMVELAARHFYELGKNARKEQPVEWEDEYREEDLRIRFAFYTYKNEEDDSVLYLSNLFVEEASRNAGFGTKILEAAEKVAETIGAITIRLKVKQDSPANAWYRKRGYGYIAFEGGYDWLEKNLEYLKPKRNEQLASDDLEEEIARYLCEECSADDEPSTSDIARHFAEWGAGNAKK